MLPKGPWMLMTVSGLVQDVAFTGAMLSHAWLISGVGLSAVCILLGNIWCHYGNLKAGSVSFVRLMADGWHDMSFTLLWSEDNFKPVILISGLVYITDVNCRLPKTVACTCRKHYQKQWLYMQTTLPKGCKLSMVYRYRMHAKKTSLSMSCTCWKCCQKSMVHQWLAGAESIAKRLDYQWLSGAKSVAKKL